MRVGWLLNVEQRVTSSLFLRKRVISRSRVRKVFFLFPSNSVYTDTRACSHRGMGYKEFVGAISMENEWFFSNAYPFIRTRKFMRFTYLDMSFSLPSQFYFHSSFHRREKKFAIHFDKEILRKTPETCKRAEKKKYLWISYKKLFSIISIELVCENKKNALETLKGIETIQKQKRNRDHFFRIFLKRDIKM